MEKSDLPNPVIVIAGASGYIGRSLIAKLLVRFPTAQITALSRTAQASQDPRVSWKSCDLFSLKSLEEALPLKIDLAFYLVHSMGPTAHLDQGSFADYDLILADNFARAMKVKQVRHLIYLGGLVPESRSLSLHLQSRLEVEQTFFQFEIPTTVFRAGLILGDAGSSFQILLKLVKRLPVMICPKWTQTLTTPVDLETVLVSLTKSALEVEHLGKIYDLAGCTPLTYLEMIQETAKKLGRKKIYIKVPFWSTTLSRLWVSVITNTPRNLVYPLIESLEHPMIARESHFFSRESLNFKYSQLLEDSFFSTKKSRVRIAFQAQRNTVRSVQRLDLPVGKNAKWVKDQYAAWLPKFLSPLIKVQSTGHVLKFSAFVKKLVLIELALNEARSNDDRQLLYIQRGLLVAEHNKGRLEFRVVLNRKYVLAAIHDYRPAMPWFIYNWTQARFHLLIMKAFGRYLKINSE